MNSTMSLIQLHLYTYDLVNVLLENIFIFSIKKGLLEFYSLYGFLPPQSRHKHKDTFSFTICLRSHFAKIIHLNHTVCNMIQILPKAAVCLSKDPFRWASVSKNKIFCFDQKQQLYHSVQSNQTPLNNTVILLCGVPTLQLPQPVSFFMLLLDCY